MIPPQAGHDRLTRTRALVQDATTRGADTIAQALNSLNGHLDAAWDTGLTGDAAADFDRIIAAAQAGKAALSARPVLATS